MAYRSFGLGESDACAMVDPTSTDVARFESTELRVIDLARREDVTRELSPDGWQGRLAGWLLGTPLARPLADSRLETLRRFASKVYFHRTDIGDHDIQTLVGAGFSLGQACGLLSYLPKTQT